MARAASVLLALGVAVGLASLVLAKPLEGKQSKATKSDDVTVEVRMPHVQPTVKDTYLCYAPPSSKDALYITGFVPHANMSSAHHVLLYGCTDPGRDEEVWNCGEMAGTGGGFTKGPICKSGAQIIYAWAMDAPELRLPEGVAFKVYGDSSIKRLVLQVHYLHVDNFLPPLNHTDHSGLTLQATHTPQQRRAGVYLLGTGGEIAPHSTVYMETACSVNDPVVIHPFAYRGHAHVHGEVVSGYRVRDGKWTELGRVSPKLPEMFYNTTSPNLAVRDGDILAARCTMVNNEDRTVKVGATSNDEMCNFYLMYWVEGDHLLSDQYCFTPGPPAWSWGQFPGLDPKAFPGDASVVPGTTKLLKATENALEDAQTLVGDAEQEDERLEAEVEAFLKQMHDRFGENALQELEEEVVPLEELGGAPVEGPYLEQRAARARGLGDIGGARGLGDIEGARGMSDNGGFEQEAEMESLLNSLYSDGYNRAYGAETPEEEDVLYDPRALRDYPQNYNPWLENGEDNYY